MLLVFDILFQFWSLFLVSSLFFQARISRLRAFLCEVCWFQYALCGFYCFCPFLIPQYGWSDFSTHCVVAWYMPFYFLFLWPYMVDVIGPLPFYISVHFLSSLSNIISFIDSVQLDLSKDDKYDKGSKMIFLSHNSTLSIFVTRRYERKTFTEWLDEISHKLHTPRVEKER